MGTVPGLGAPPPSRAVGMHMVEYLLLTTFCPCLGLP